MGRHSWMIEEQKMMLLTHCPEDHFTCNDATYVPMEQLCDYKFDCKDMIDEATCVWRYCSARSGWKVTLWAVFWLGR